MRCYISSANPAALSTGNNLGFYKKKVIGLSSQIEGKFTPQNPMRLWEYSKAIKAVHTRARQLSAEDQLPHYLDIGCAGSPIPYIFRKMLDMDIECVDLKDCKDEFKAQGIYDTIEFHNENFLEISEVKYDAITCISVLEHVSREEQDQILKKAIRMLKSGGIFFLTVDSHQSGQKLCTSHERTYTEKQIRDMAEIFCYEDDVIFDDYYNPCESFVHHEGANYNFTSMLFEKDL
jgi:cyclopropane fatty-acyl-phospholipid synthase-like methyltransferase